jgi:hypothetical protein
VTTFRSRWVHIDIRFVDVAVVGVVTNDARIQFFGVAASKYDLTTTVVATAVAFKQMFQHHVQRITARKDDQGKSHDNGQSNGRFKKTKQHGYR